MIKVTFEFDTAQAAVDAINLIQPTSAVAKTTKATKPAAEKLKEAETAKAAEAPKAETTKAAVDAPDYETVVKPKALELAKAKGRDVLVNLYKKYNVENAKDLAPELRQQFIDDANDAILV